MTHTCRALVVCCMDFRLQTAVRDFLVSRGLLDQYDLTGELGAAKSLTDDIEEEGQYLLRKIDIALQKHKITEVIIIQHTDCAAFGGGSAFSSYDRERHRMLDVLERARGEIQSRFPQLKITKALAVINNGQSAKIDFEEI